MTWKNPEVDYKAELRTIRKTYVASTAKQRLRVIGQRLGYKDSGPNNLVTAVSAVEALSRSMVLRHIAKGADDLQAKYHSFRYKGAEELLLFIMAFQGGDDPTAFYGEDNWELLEYAVAYRNLVTHECTYVGDDESPSMIQACREILVQLASIAGVDDFDPDL